jgi:methionine synthase I (cobalamin-dependent)
VVCVFDGATGTELERRGCSVRGPLGASASLVDAPDRVEAIHREYVDAGAQVLTTNTLCLTSMDPQRHLFERGVWVARTARARSHRADRDRVRIAGSIGPALGTAFAEPARRQRAYEVAARRLMAAGCDALILEAMTSALEARIAWEACRAVTPKIWIALVCTHHGRTLAGEAPEELGAAVAPGGGRFDPLGILVGCSDLDAVEPNAGRLRRCGLAIGALPHAVTRPVAAEVAADPVAFVDALHRATTCESLDFVGGCCGTRPKWIAALVARVHPTARARERGFARLEAALAGCIVDRHPPNGASEPTPPPR